MWAQTILGPCAAPGLPHFMPKIGKVRKFEVKMLINECLMSWNQKSNVADQRMFDELEVQRNSFIPQESQSLEKLFTKCTSKLRNHKHILWEETCDENGKREYRSVRSYRALVGFTSRTWMNCHDVLINDKLLTHPPQGMAQMHTIRRGCSSTSSQTRREMNWKLMTTHASIDVFW